MVLVLLADISTTSFFPAKPLGDGGAVFTNDEENEKFMVNHHKYIGRLDTIQAAVKLKYYPKDLAKRALGLILPSVDKKATSAWAQ